MRNTALTLHLRRVPQAPLTCPQDLACPLAAIRLWAGLAFASHCLLPPTLSLGERGHWLCFVAPSSQRTGLLLNSRLSSSPAWRQAVAFGRTGLNGQETSRKQTLLGAQDLLGNVPFLWPLLFFFYKIKHTIGVGFPKQVACPNIVQATAFRNLEILTRSVVVF